ncbi:MAG: UDP-N-acetylmuramate--L-alanine ligase [Candidatus Omnitrophica bacterium]|nr:UDP-N-acetylmuramate--L-alanine ligase [Candidatus Omnitrophota bacterium]
MVSSRKKIHFVGVGGIGMSGIARVLLEMGHEVSGSDIEKNHITDRLEGMGGKMFAGHRASNLPADADILVYSSSISRNNPEVKAALRRRVRIMHRAGMLGEIFNRRKGIAISGTHGKTTTTSLISVMLENAGLKPTAIIGGEVSRFGGNAKTGEGEYAVVEADESDGSFVRLKPMYAVITNIEMEHLDHFRSLGHIRSAFRAFIDNVKPGGSVFYNIEDLNIRIMMKGFRRHSESFGFSKEADIYPTDIRMDGFRALFKCVYKNRLLGTVSLSIPGRHNILNALAAVLVGLKAGISFREIAGAIKDFDGAKRRFQLRADADGVMLIDDYAHHPTEIRAVLDVCRNWKGRRVIAVFQPHRYSRTKFLAEEFGRCFKGVDKLILTDIYSASEKEIKGVSIMNIYTRVKDSGISDVEVLPKDMIPGRIMKIKKPGDIVLVLGAGDIKSVADRLSGMMNKNACASAGYRGYSKLAPELKKTVKGKVKTGEKLSAHTSFRIGGPADLWVEPADAVDLKRLLRFVRKHKVPMLVIGNGSNVLARDRGFSGLLAHLGNEFFKSIRITGTTVRVGAGFSLPRLVKTACDKGLGGLESLVGIPGTVGGAISMNAGGHKNPAYRNIGELIRSLKVMDFSGKTHTLSRKDLRFGYRSSNLDRYVILEAELELDRSGKESLNSSCRRFLKIKRDKQVLDAPSAGCMFKNPDNFQFTCGQMIDMLKLKGKRIGAAEISEKHANFIINRGGATCRDVLDLAEYVRDKVRENYGMDLDMEVKLI